MRTCDLRIFFTNSQLIMVYYDNDFSVIVLRVGASCMHRRYLVLVPVDQTTTHFIMYPLANFETNT